MQLTFRNHGRVQLPVFTNSVSSFFFESNTGTEQVNVIQHEGKSFPLTNEEVRRKRRTHLAATRRRFEKCHVQAGPRRGSRASDALTPPPERRGSVPV